MHLWRHPDGGRQAGSHPWAAFKATWYVRRHGSACNIQVTLTDKGSPGTYDSIAITVWNKSGGLWFASNWNGAKTIGQILSGGDLSVH
jgi:hypothetical protein